MWVKTGGQKVDNYSYLRKGEKETNKRKEETKGGEGLCTCDGVVVGGGGGGQLVDERLPVEGMHSLHQIQLW